MFCVSICLSYMFLARHVAFCSGVVFVSRLTVSLRCDTPLSATVRSERASAGNGNGAGWLELGASSRSSSCSCRQVGTTHRTHHTITKRCSYHSHIVKQLPFV